MRFTYCPDCGTKLTMKEIGDEGMMPYCESCKKPWWDMFSSCIIVLVYNDRGEVALLNQGYISTRYRNLVSGYMKPGETAESTAVREVEEEIGIKIDRLTPVRTVWFKPKGLLMIGYLGHAANTDFTTSPEVDHVEWVRAEDAVALVHPKSEASASAMLVEEYVKRLTSGSVQ